MEDLSEEVYDMLGRSDLCWFSALYSPEMKGKNIQQKKNDM